MRDSDSPRSIGADRVPTRPNVRVGALLLKRARDTRQGCRVSLAHGGRGIGEQEVILHVGPPVRLVQPAEGAVSLQQD